LIATTKHESMATCLGQRASIAHERAPALIGELEHAQRTPFSTFATLRADRN
jgi:hypothetical protein